MKRSQACRITAHSQLKTACGSFKSPPKTATPSQVLPKLILLQNQVETSMSLKITGNHFETGSSDAKRRGWLAVEAELVAGMGLDLTGVGQDGKDRLAGPRSLLMRVKRHTPTLLVTASQLSSVKHKYKDRYE